MLHRLFFRKTRIKHLLRDRCVLVFSISCTRNEKSNINKGVCVQGGLCPGGLCQGESLSGRSPYSYMRSVRILLECIPYGSLPDRDSPLDRDPPWTETSCTETPPVQRPPGQKPPAPPGQKRPHWTETPGTPIPCEQYHRQV